MSRKYVKKRPKKSYTEIVTAFLYASSVVSVVYVLLGPFPFDLFSIPFFGGFVAWLLMTSVPPFSAVRVPYFVAWIFFILHKLEERQFGFFSKLAYITGTPAPNENSTWSWILYLLAGFWVLVLMLAKGGVTLGYSLTWTFFLAMGVVELAHFVFPLMTGQPYAYFPGMTTAAPLSAAGLWGVYRMAKAGKPLVPR